MIPEHFTFKYLKARVSIAAVLQDKGLISAFRKRGHQLVGPCPVHGGDNPNAFVISLYKNIWHCFTQCNAGGDVVALVRLLDSKTYRQSAAYLASLANTPKASSMLHQTHMTKAFRPFTKSLTLNASTPWLKKKGIALLTAKRFEAGAYDAPGFLNGCIGVRLHDLQGHPIGYAGRRRHPKQVKLYGKWKLPPALPKSALLYNFHRVRGYTHKTLVIVEGPWAVMRLAQLSIPAVALLGIHLSPTQRDLLRTLQRVILMLDGDFAGHRATTRIRDALEPNSKVDTITLPLDHDPDDLTDDQLSSITKHLFL
ncbi:MAG: toprim domain-containing protein [Desulfobacterales bacterium]